MKLIRTHKDVVQKISFDHIFKQIRCLIFYFLINYPFGFLPEIKVAIIHVTSLWGYKKAPELFGGKSAQGSA